MMGNRHLRNLRDTVTYWSTGEPSWDGFTFGAPITLSGRWEEFTEMIRTPSGEEKASRGTVYLAQDVGIGDYLALGDHTGVTDPTTLAGAYRVMDFQKISNLRNIETERKARI